MLKLISACAWFLLLGTAAACPTRFQPRAAPELPRAGNADARARFEQARARFEQGEHEAAARELETIIVEFPADPIAKHATLYLGMAAMRRQEHAEVVRVLEPLLGDPEVDESLEKRARFYVGIASGRMGKHERAREVLEPLVGKVAAGEEEGELFAVLAEAFAASGDGDGALRFYDEFFARARPAERAYVTARVSAIVDALSAQAVSDAYAKADKEHVAAALLGRRLALMAKAAGDSARAREILDETRSARVNAGIPDDSSAVGVANPQLIGALLPLSGKRRRVGDAALRGLAVAAGTFGSEQKGDNLPLVVVARDAAPGNGLVAAVDALDAERPIAVIGPIDKDTCEEAARRAEALALPLVTLDFADSSWVAGSPHVFVIALSVEARAKALAKHAFERGARTFAILTPEIAYGTRASKAFRDEVSRLGGHVVAHVTYAKDATHFVQPVNALAGKAFDALLVPDTADRLELIAPQLAASGFSIQPAATSKAKKGHGILLLATAEALAPKFLRGSGRYTTHAVLAPGFYPDETDPRIGPFVQGYRAAHGEDPTYLAAFAFDAALVVRSAVEKGARDRDSVAAAMAAGTVRGVTGDVRFDAHRQRADLGVLYVVEPDGAGGQRIKALAGKQ
ncbi:MAG: penicillin-binding protein activator [Deltaproteobacteria bacterium]|nr:penicillin-binding protein activator [Deltaproteobacteria bacterium]